MRCKLWIVTKRGGIKLHTPDGYCEQFNDLRDFLRRIESFNDENVCFFNNLSWIRQTPLLKKFLSQAIFAIRSGGNDILRAPFEDDSIPLSVRQNKIIDYINRCIDILIVNSDYSYLRNIELGIHPEKMVKIRGGVDYKLISDLAKQKVSIREKFDSLYKTHKKQIITIACRMVDFKGIPNFIEYYKNLERQNYFLLLVGDGKDGNKIRDKLSACLKKSEYAFLGEQTHDKALEYISISDIVVNSAIYCQRYFGEEFYIHTETMGRTMLEACVAGVPIVATNVGGTNELFQENSYIGTIVNSWDDLSDVLSTLTRARNVELCNDYSWEKVFLRYEEVFTGLKRKRIYVLDIDNTILHEGLSPDDIAGLLSQKKNENLLVLNTARNYSQELMHFVQKSQTDILITDNGMEIFCGGKINREWENFVKKHLFFHEMGNIELKMKKTFPLQRMKITHPNSFVIWRDGQYADCKIEEQLKSLFSPMQFQLILTQRHIKLLNRMINKKTATEFIFKNHIPCLTVSAGDSINDIGFCSICDIAFINSKILHEMPPVPQLYSFNDDEIGTVLIKRIFADNKNI